MPDPDIIYQYFKKNQARFPYLRQDPNLGPRLYLNSGAGSLNVDNYYQQIERVSFSLVPMPGQLTAPEQDTASLQQQVRELAADFVGALSPEEISFHFSTTAALFNLAYALRHLFQDGKNCLVTDLDHFANISPWETVAAERGTEIRRVKIGPDYALSREDLLKKLDEKTVVVALTAASNALGSIVPLADIIQEIKARSRALVVVDAVHLAPHAPLDVMEFGCDFLAFSGYKIFGPMIGILYARKEHEHLLRPYRVETNKPKAPYFLEQGMLPNLALAGLKGALEYLAELGSDFPTQSVSGNLSRRKKFRLSLELIKSFEQQLSGYFLERWKKDFAEVMKVYGPTDQAKITGRVPTFAFELASKSPSEAKKLFWEKGRIIIADGNHYSAAVVRHLGKPAINRISLAHYDDLSSLDLFFETLEKIIKHN